MNEEQIKSLFEKIDSINTKLEKQEVRLSALESEARESVVPSGTPVRMPLEYFLDKTKQGAGAVHARVESAKSALASGAASKSVSVGEESGGRWLGKIGVIAILFGVSFFLKYAFDNNLIGEAGRVALGIFAGIGFLGLGQFLRKKYAAYGDVLMGGGLGILYLTIYAAYAFYRFIDQPIALALLLMITVLSCVISMVNDTPGMAGLGIFAGFLTPVLLSRGTNEFFALMSYILVLDLGILGLTIFKKWQQLNLIGFLGTVFYVMGWMGQYYTSDYFLPLFAFATIFFVVYLIASLAHHVIRKEASTGFDLLLINANALSYFAVGYLLLNEEAKAAVGFFAVVLAVVYFVLAYLGKWAQPDDRKLNLFLPGLAVLFLTLAVPLQFGGFWVTLAWFVEALLIYVVAFMTRQGGMRVFGLAVYGIGLVRYFMFDSWYRDFEHTAVIFNHRFFLIVFAIVIAYIIAYWYKDGEKDFAGDPLIQKGMVTFFILANLLSVYALTAETNFFYAKKLYVVERSMQEKAQAEATYRGDDGVVNYDYTAYYAESSSVRNQRNTAVSIIWALYAIILISLGFVVKSKGLRLAGLIFFFVTAVKVFIDVWSLGQLYRIVTSIAFGVIALIASFVYVKYKDRVKELL